MFGNKGCLNSRLDPFDQLLRRDGQVRVLDGSGDLVPPEVPIEANTDPAEIADIGWDEVVLGRGLDQRPLDVR